MMGWICFLEIHPIRFHFIKNTSVLLDSFQVKLIFSDCFMYVNSKKCITVISKCSECSLIRTESFVLLSSKHSLDIVIVLTETLNINFCPQGP